jgi:hypothetical protein
MSRSPSSGTAEDHLATRTLSMTGATLGVTPAATGSYLHRTKAAASSAESYDADRERALWAWLERVPSPCH